MSRQAINRARATMLPSVVSAVVTSAQVFPDAATITLPAFVTVPGGGVLEQKKFIIEASGKIVTGTTTNVTLALNAGVAAPTIASPGTTIFTSTARAQNSATAPFFLEAELIFDSASGKLHGTVKDLLNNLFDGAAVVTSVVTGISGAQGSAEPAIYFTLQLTFSASNAGNIGTLSTFDLNA